MIANVTDIDDKILAKSAEAGRALVRPRLPVRARAARGVRGARLPAADVRAAGDRAHPEMIELIEMLIERGHAYAAADGSGDVYFDVRSWPAYGSLSGQRIDDMEPAEDADPRGKRDPRDFALWKGHKHGEPDTAVLADAVGPRPARLAPGVLGDGRQVPRRRVRHPRRRARPALPAPRERARPVDRGRAARSPGSGCTTRWSPPPGRR